MRTPYRDVKQYLYRDIGNCWGRVSKLAASFSPLFENERGFHHTSNRAPSSSDTLVKIQSERKPTQIFMLLF